MTIGKMPEWWADAEPYFIYDEDKLKISDAAPKELKKEFEKWQKKIDESYKKNKKLEIVNMANYAGYNYAVLAGYWNDCDVYRPFFWVDEIPCVGLPVFVLVKGEEVRLTKNPAEAFKVMDEMEECSLDELENDPIELEPNLTIKSFKFERDGYGGNYKRFEYKSNKRGKILTYIEEGEYEPSIAPAKVRIDDKNFDKYALGMIKYFHEDFGTNEEVCDGEWYEFKATLSNGQKLKSHGYNYFPFNYVKFITYLEHYWDDTSNIIEYLP